MARMTTILPILALQSCIERSFERALSHTERRQTKIRGVLARFVLSLSVGYLKCGQPARFPGEDDLCFERSNLGGE